MRSESLFVETTMLYTNPMPKHSKHPQWERSLWMSTHRNQNIGRYLQGISCISDGHAPHCGRPRNGSRREPYTWIRSTCECVPPKVRETAPVTSWHFLTGDELGLSRWGPGNHRDPYREEGQCGRPLAPAEGKGTNISPWIPRRNATPWTLLTLLQKHKILCFKSLNFLSFL